MMLPFQRRLWTSLRRSDFQRVFMSSRQDFDSFDGAEDHFGLTNSKRDKKFYARCFRLLELDVDSSQDIVRKKYIELAKKYHPDSGAAASLKRFQRIDEAYRELMKKFSEDKRNEESSVGEFGLYYDPDREKSKNDEPSFENSDIQQDIDHIAPQHRQYLSNEGFGFGTPGQRQKQYQKFRAFRAMENVTEHKVQKITAKYETQLAVKDGKAAKKHKTQNAMERLVEDLISESMAKGDFDNLSGSGKPLPQRVIYNPYEDFTTNKMNQILVDGGFAPEWVMLRKEIHVSKLGIREKLVIRCDKLLSDPKMHKKTPDQLKQDWAQVLENFRENEVKSLNKDVDKFNLMVPMIRSQIFHFNLDSEAEKVWNDEIVKLQQKLQNNSKIHAEEKPDIVDNSGNVTAEKSAISNFVQRVSTYLNSQR